MTALVYNQIPIFFTRLHGFVSVSSSDFDGIDCLNQSAMAIDAAESSQLNQTYHNETATNLTIYDINPDDVYNADDVISQIKAAFIYHLKKNSSKCTAILQQLLADSNVAADLDKIVVKIAQDLVEDIPASDPRWEEQLTMGNRHALGSSQSMQIVQQLKEKSRALGHFVDFMHATGVWNQLDVISEKNHMKSTFHILSDLNEKIVAGIALKSIHNA